MIEAAGAIAGLLGAASAAGGAVKGYIETKKYLAERRKKRARREAQWEEVVVSVKRLREDTDRVLHEVRVNSGSSLRDAVDVLTNDLAIERAARRLHGTVAVYDVRYDEATNRYYDLHVSPQYKRITGLDAEGANNFGWLKWVHPQDRDRVRAAAISAAELRAVMVTQYTGVNVETRTETRVEHRAYPVLVSDADQRERIIGWVGSLLPEPLDDPILAQFSTEHL